MNTFARFAVVFLTTIAVNGLSGCGNPKVVGDTASPIEMKKSETPSLTPISNETAKVDGTGKSRTPKSTVGVKSPASTNQDTEMFNQFTLESKPSAEGLADKPKDTDSQSPASAIVTKELKKKKLAKDKENSVIQYGGQAISPNTH